MNSHCPCNIALNITKRTKEIGIRKALGASIGNILTLLNREFVIVLSVAAVLGSLAGYFFTDALLTLISVFHIPVGIIPVMMCALVIFGIGVLTTSATIMKGSKVKSCGHFENRMIATWW